MRRAYLTAYGNPADVVQVREDPEPGALEASQVLVEILAASINPAELLLIQGKYASKPPLPAMLGIEGAGRVTAVGAKVSHIKAGDLVLCMPRANWAERIVFEQSEVIVLPADCDPLQAGMLKVNPATALMMLRDMVSLKPGDWVVQNAANSAVGRNLIRLAKSMQLKTANIVRRADLATDLKNEGADLVVVDGPDMAAQLRDQVDGPVRLAIDAIGGTATLRLADCLADGGWVVNYGLLSGEPCQIGADQAIFRSISLRGFWLAKELSAMEPSQVQALYQDLGKQVASGVLGVPVQATYPLSQLPQALNHAMQDGRSGKILITPNPV